MPSLACSGPGCRPTCGPQPTDAGQPAGDVLKEPATAEALLTHAPTSGFRTRRTSDYLAWRTSLPALHYRLLLASNLDPAEGGLVFRLRRRGDALEAAVIEALVPDTRTGIRLVRRMLRETRADYAVGLRGAGSLPLVPLPRQGPRLTARPLAATPPSLAEWTLTLGDVELF